MPSKKRRGKAKKALVGGVGKKKLISEQFQEDAPKLEVQSEAGAEETTVNTELLEAQSTIERLAKKYLRQSFDASSQSLDIVKSDSVIVKESTERGGEDGMDVFNEEVEINKDERKENEQSFINMSLEALASNQSMGMLRKKQTTAMKSPTMVMRRVRHPRAKRAAPRAKVEVNRKLPKDDRVQKFPLSSPELKLPQPTLGHSTPGDIGPSLAPRRDSLFGFDVLESPLVLSPVPVVTYPDDDKSSSVSPKQRESSEEVKRKSMPAQMLLGTYDIPLRKPTPKGKKKAAKQKNKRSSLAEEEWIKKLTSEFTEVDDFELVVE